MLELQKLLIKYSNKRGASSIREFYLLHNLPDLTVLYMEIMAEDWMCLELGMRLQIGVLWYVNTGKFLALILEISSDLLRQLEVQ